MLTSYEQQQKKGLYGVNTCNHGNVIFVNMGYTNLASR